MSNPLTEEQVRRCQARAKANHSTLEQELFLERGGTLNQWYGMPEDARAPRPLRPAKDLVEARTRAICLRMVEAVGSQLGDLRMSHIVALTRAAMVIAVEHDAITRFELERKTVDRAVEIASGG